MGHELTLPAREDIARALPPWLDTATAALVADLVVTLAERFADLRAVLLYGSIARHDERPLDAENPSDVDLLAVFDTDDELVTVHRGLAVADALGPAFERHLDAPRDVQVMLASRGLREWDVTFLANVARDGWALLARGPLPRPLRQGEPGASGARAKAGV